MDLRLPTDSPDEIGQLAAAFNEMGQRLQREAARKPALSEDLRRQGKVREKLLKRRITAQEEERRRVARDLHDDLGQDLVGLAAHLEAVERMWADPPEKALQQIRQTRTLIAEPAERA